MSKLIVIEGTDCSGKETQSNLLRDTLEKNGIKVYKDQFPKYDTPTGKIIGGPYLGKEYICDTWFEEGASNVDPLISSVYYAADRRYNIDIIKSKLEEGYIVILDRYVSSNMGHQAGKIIDDNKRKELYKKLEILEYELMELPKPDLTIFLYMPTEYAKILKENRTEASDGLEKDEKHLLHAEKTYLELANLYSYVKVNCVENEKIRSIDEIGADVYNVVLSELVNVEENKYSKVA